MPDIPSSAAGSASLGPTKSLYRRVDTLLGELHASVHGEAFVAKAACELFAAFQAELGLRAVAAYAHGAGEIEPLVSAGVENGAPPPREIELRPPARVQLQALGAREVGASFTLHTARRPCTLVFAFDAVAQAASELFVSTAASVLELRLLEERLGVTLREAAEIQQSLLPQTSPSFPGFEIAARSVSASEVGGDWYDFLPLGEDALGLAIGDASGHGLPAALMARDVVIGLRMGIERELKAGYALSKLNRVIHASSLSSRFVSLFYGELEENGSFFHYCAGHERPLLLQNGVWSTLGAGDPVLGPLPEVRFRRRFDHLDRGALLALYTDGIIECRGAGGELFGIERLKALLAANASSSAEELVARCFDELDRFRAGELERDDATLVIVRRLAR